MEQAFGRTLSALNMAGSAIIFTIMMLIVLDVGSRNLIGAPLQGVTELVKLSVPVIAWLIIPHTLRSGAHLRSTMLLVLLPTVVQRIIVALNSLIGMDS